MKLRIIPLMLFFSASIHAMEITEGKTELLGKPKLTYKEIEPLNQQLIEAVLQNKAILVKQLISKGADVETKHNGRTSLHIAAKNNNLSIIKILLDNNANVNAADSPVGALTPLIIALQQGHYLVVEALLKAGADNLLLPKPLFAPGMLQEDAQLVPLYLLSKGKNPALALKKMVEQNALLPVTGIEQTSLFFTKIKEILGLPGKPTGLTALVMAHSIITRSTITDCYSVQAITTKDKAGMNPLLWAAAAHNLRAAKLFLDCCAQEQIPIPPPTKVISKIINLFTKTSSPMTLRTIAYNDENESIFDLAAQRIDRTTQKNNPEMLNLLYSHPFMRTLLYNHHKGDRIQLLYTFDKDRTLPLPPCAQHLIIDYVFDGGALTNQEKKESTLEEAEPK